MQKLFISDLHLSEQYPRLVRGFLSLLDQYKAQPTELYILGDWFNTWLSDGDPSEWLLPVVHALREFCQTGNKIYFLVGNRDFVLGQSFLDRFDGILLKEPYMFQWQDTTFRLEHGDSLCTDDVSYQRFKKVIRNPVILGSLKLLPFYLKRRLGDFFRAKSKDRQIQRIYQPIDVNQAEVEKQMQGVDILIHGHTHRPEIHSLSAQKQRIVLGDWREKSGDARILLMKDSHHFDFFDWKF